MANVHQVKVQPLTEQAFEPFGEIMGARESVEFQGLSGTEMWAMDFQMSGRLQLGFLRVKYQGLTFNAMEQHHGVTQSFIPMGGAPSVVALAPPTARGTTPGPEDVRAFLLDGTRGYILRKNTWHTLNRFPLHPPGNDWIVLTDWETTADLKASGGVGDKLTRTVDFEQELGVTFEFVL